ncbi:MAG: ketosteroid isomerase [Caulobacter sp.]|nr:ketosteroid isomerase [Caulobacter sp.]
MDGAGTEARLRALYEAFNRRDIEAAIAGLHPDVDWPNGLEGGREFGWDAVRAYWTRQFAVIDSQVTPMRFSAEPAGRTVVEVRQVVRDTAGALISDGLIEHVYTFEGGLVRSMEIRGRAPAAPS